MSQVSHRQHKQCSGAYHNLHGVLVHTPLNHSEACQASIVNNKLPTSHSAQASANQTSDKLDIYALCNKNGTVPRTQERTLPSCHPPMISYRCACARLEDGSPGSCSWGLTRLVPDVVPNCRLTNDNLIEIRYNCVLPSCMSPTCFTLAPKVACLHCKCCAQQLSCQPAPRRRQPVVPTSAPNVETSTAAAFFLLAKGFCITEQDIRARPWGRYRTLP